VKEFIVFLRASRETFLDDATAEEMEIVERHFHYLKDRLAEGRLILAGRCQDTPLGIAIFEADDENDARKQVAYDPAVQAGVFQAEVRPYGVALMRGRD
jgi:uncharacterized protein YciI